MYFQINKIKWHVDKTEHFWHHFLFAFNRGADVAKIVREICAVRVKWASITSRYHPPLFFALPKKKFNSRTEDTLVDQLILIKNNWNISTRKSMPSNRRIVGAYGVLKKTVVNHIISMSNNQKFKKYIFLNPLHKLFEL